MKKKLLFASLLSLSVSMYAENDSLSIEHKIDSLVRVYYDSLSNNPIFDTNKITVLENGNVGIDTINPNYKLEVNGDIKGTKIIGLEAWSIQPQENWPTSFNLSNNTGFWHMSAPRIWDSNGNVVPNFMGIYWASQQGTNISYKNVMSLQETGNVGIGTESPTEKLDVVGKNQGTELWGYDRRTAYPSSVNLKNDHGFWHISGPRGYEGDDLAMFWVPDGSINNYGDYVRALTIEKSGNVAIGTHYSKGYKLAVNGKIAAEEVVVAAYKDWPDYVFSNEYNLPKLSEVEEFVNENSHLPDVPSAATVAEEGVSLGEMNKILLQKVEELTLYIIEQEKRMENMQKQINSLK